MKLRGVLVAVALVAGCTLPRDRTNLADGVACEASDECRSGACANGYCEGRACSTGDPSSCDPGWRCTKYNGTFFTSGSVECVPLCGVCPANTHCPVGGEDGVTPCEDGPPRKVTITGPARVKVNEEITLSVDVDPPFATVTYVEWKVGEKAGQGQSFAPDATTVTTRLGIDVEADLVVSVVVHGTVRQNVFESAGGTLNVHSACLAEGDVCDADGEGYDHPQYCCGAGLYCPGATNSKAPQFCAVNR